MEPATKKMQRLITFFISGWYDSRRRETFRDPGKSPTPRWIACAFAQMRLQSFGGFGIILGIPEPIPRSTTMNELSRTEARDLARCEDVIERGLHTFLE